MYTFDEFSKLFGEHAKGGEIKLHASGFSIGFDDSKGLEFETEGGTPKEYHYLYFLFTKIKKNWRWTGVCHDPMRKRGFIPSSEFN